MEKKPLVSIIINCHNGEKFLSNCIQSILKQTFKNYEIIFFDNQSTDRSKEIIKNYKDRRIRYFFSKKFLKLYAARNKALKKCKGTYVCFCDTDDLWKKNKLSYQIAFMRKNNSLISYTNFIIKNEKKNLDYLVFKNLPSGFITQKLLDSYCIGIMTVMINRKLLLLNKFNSKYNIIGDFDLFLRLSLNNKFSAIQKPLAYYRVHDGSVSSTKLRMYYREYLMWLKDNIKLSRKFSIRGVRISILKLKIKFILSFILKFFKIITGRVVQW